MPFQIRSTTFHNIKNFATLNISFGSKITCLIGENGIGKTTILQALSWGLVGNIEDLSIDNSFVRLKNDAINKEEIASIELDYGHAVNKLVIETKPPLYKTIPKFYTDGKEPFAQENGLLNQLFIVFSQQTQKKDKRRDNRSKIRQANIDDVSSFLMGEPDTRFDDVLDWLAASMDTNTSLDERDATLPVIQKVLEVIGEITNTPMRLVEETNARSEVKVEFTETGQRMPLRFLSQGFNNVIGWVGFFMKRLWESTPDAQKLDFKNAHAICLIDEIDTYLHPKWQRTVLATLAKHFPNTQFIVTTHSPIVITHLPNENDSVKIYKVLNNNDIVPLIAAGRDIRSFLLEWFDINERPDFAQKEINALYVLLEKEELNIPELRAELTRLRLKYTENDPDVLQIEQILNVLED
jgi:predicted ATP-binding protein involved in virulence